MLGFLIHNKVSHGFVRMPPITKGFKFGLTVRHIRKIMSLEPLNFEKIKSPYDWSHVTFFSFVSFTNTLLFVRDIRRLHDYKFINYFQFWSLRAQYLNTNPYETTPFLRSIPQFYINVVTRFYEPSYFSHFLSILFLYTRWSPIFKWKIYKPNVFALKHFYEWPEGPFCAVFLN